MPDITMPDITMPDITMDRIVQIDSPAGRPPTSVDEVPSVEIAGGPGNTGRDHPDDVTANPPIVVG